MSNCWNEAEAKGVLSSEPEVNSEPACVEPCLGVAQLVARRHEGTMARRNDSTTARKNERMNERRHEVTTVQWYDRTKERGDDKRGKVISSESGEEHNKA